MNKSSAAEPGETPGEGEKPSEVSTQEKDNQGENSESADDQQDKKGQSDKEKSKSSAKDGENEAEDESSSEEEDEESEEEGEDKKDKSKRSNDPVIRRLRRGQKALKKTIGTIKESHAELLNVVKEVLANQKGEDFKPSEKKESAIEDFDFDEILDDETEALVAELEKDGKDIPDGLEEEIAEIAKEYASEIKGKKVYLTAKQAYGIWQKLQEVKGSVEEKPKSKNAKKPSKRGSSDEKEDKVGNYSDMINQTGSVADVVARATRLAKSLNK